MVKVSKDKVEILKPRKYDPPSPRKIDEGNRLKLKKAKHVANIIKEMSNPSILFNSTNLAKNTKLNIETILTNNPSSPSSQFIAFVIPTIQNIEKILLKIVGKTIVFELLKTKGIIKLFILNPLCIINIAKIISTNNLINGDKL